MNKIIKSLLASSILLIVSPIMINMISGCQVERLWIHLFDILVLLMILQHSYLSVAGKHVVVQSLKMSILSGGLSGIILAWVGRVGLALNYLLLSSDRKMLPLIHFFIDYWQIYLWMGLLGMVCMSIEPFFRDVLHKDLLKQNQAGLTNKNQ